MKNQALFSSKDKVKKLKCRLLQFLFGALQVKNSFYFTFIQTQSDSPVIASYTQRSTFASVKKLESDYKCYKICIMF